MLILFNYLLVHLFVITWTSKDSLHFSQSAKPLSKGSKYLKLINITISMQSIMVILDISIIS